jgi:hypothetical protein
MGNPKTNDAEVGRRVTRLWKRLGYDSSAEFARKMKIDPRRLNNVEVGFPLGKDLAFTLRQAVPGLTTDWLWFGDPAKLSLELAELLEGPEQPTRRKARS